MCIIYNIHIWFLNVSYIISGFCLVSNMNSNGFLWFHHLAFIKLYCRHYQARERYTLIETPLNRTHVVADYDD